MEKMNMDTNEALHRIDRRVCWYRKYLLLAQTVAGFHFRMRGKRMKVKKKHLMHIQSEISQQQTNSRNKQNLTFNLERTTMSFRTLKGKKKEHENERIGGGKEEELVKEVEELEIKEKEN